MATRPRPTAAAMTMLTSRRVRSRLLISLSWQFPPGYHQPGPCPARPPPGLSATLPQPGALTELRGAGRHHDLQWIIPCRFVVREQFDQILALALQDEPPKLVNSHV